MWARRALAALLLAGSTGLPDNSVQSAEGATGTYLLGYKGSMAGYLPPPGVYVQDTNYLYSGQTNAALSFAGLTIAAGVNADVFYKLPTLLRVCWKRFLGEISH